MAKPSRVRNIVDVARKCGVSISTVSRALNNEPGISSRTRQRILKTAEELKFTPKKRKRPRNRSTWTSWWWCRSRMSFRSTRSSMFRNCWGPSTKRSGIKEAHRDHHRGELALFIDADRPDSTGYLRLPGRRRYLRHGSATTAFRTFS